MLTRIGVYVRFGRERNVRVTLLRRRNGVPTSNYGMICGNLALNLRNWSFNHVRNLCRTGISQAWR